jgi:hypothetical protein
MAADFSSRRRAIHSVLDECLIVLRALVRKLEGVLFGVAFRVKAPKVILSLLQKYLSVHSIGLPELPHAVIIGTVKIRPVVVKFEFPLSRRVVLDQGAEDLEFEVS